MKIQIITPTIIKKGEREEGREEGRKEGRKEGKRVTEPQ